METVTVSQAPAVSEAPAVVVPPAGGATMAVLPSAVQDLARFLLNLAGSSSLGEVGGVAGMAASASGVLQGVTRKKRTATDLLVLTRLFGT